MLWEGMRGWGSSLRVESGLTAGHLLSLSIAFSYILRWAQGRTFDWGRLGHVSGLFRAPFFRSLYMIKCCKGSVCFGVCGLQACKPW